MHTTSKSIVSQLNSHVSREILVFYWSIRTPHLTKAGTGDHPIQSSKRLLTICSFVFICAVYIWELIVVEMCMFSHNIYWIPKKSWGVLNITNFIVFYLFINNKKRLKFPFNLVSITYLRLSIKLPSYDLWHFAITHGGIYCKYK